MGDSGEQLDSGRLFNGPTICGILALSTMHLFVGSIIYDVAHWVAHHSHRSPYWCFRLLARTHAVHHKFFDRNLNFNQKFRLKNMLLHLPSELLFQMTGSLLSSIIVETWFPTISQMIRPSLMLVFVIEITRSGIVAWNSGYDSNHMSYSTVPKDPNFLFVGPQYHALHHMDPHHYFGSMTRLVDWIAGTAVSLQGRRVALTGSRGSFGLALSKQLSLEKVKCIHPLRFGIEWNYESYSGLESILANTDILVLAHGSKDPNQAVQANCKSSAAIIELFKLCRGPSKTKLLPEVWYVGSEAELHGAWTSDMEGYTNSKRAFVPFARAYYDENSFIYRHIVPAAFDSGMGHALVTADWAARVAIWWIRRGARYVPVTYTGIAFVNYFRFIYLNKAWT